MSSLKWLLPLLCVCFSSYGERIRIRVSGRAVYQAQPQQSAQYYRPPQLPATNTSKAYWNGGSYDQAGSFGVKQTYQTGANHQCTHTPNGTVCTNNLHADRQYEFSNYGQPYANGAYNNSSGGQRTYNHNGDPNRVAEIQRLEDNIANTNQVLAQSLQKGNALAVRIKATRERLLLSRNVYNAATVDRDLRELDNLERELNSVQSEVRQNASRLNSLR